VRRRVGGAARSARGPSERRSRSRCHGAMNHLSEIRIICPKFGHIAYPRRGNEFGKQPGMCSRRACLRGSARSNGAVITIARLRRPSVGGRWLSPERPNETPPVTSDAGLSLLTTQCRFFEGDPWSPDPGPFEPGNDKCGLDAGLTAAGERPGGPVALLAHSTVCAARNPRCASWSHLPGRDATALSARTRQMPNADSWPPGRPGGSVSRRPS
jgi:hypothetical protein